VQSRVKGQIPQKGTASANSCRAYDVWRSWAQDTFLFRESECDPVSELKISRQKIRLLVIVYRYGSIIRRLCFATVSGVL